MTAAQLFELGVRPKHTVLKAHLKADWQDGRNEAMGSKRKPGS